MENICDMILRKRKEHGLTQSELGAMLGISGKAVSKWERGLSTPCNEHLSQLVDLLGLPGAMIGVCVCNLAGMVSTESTVVSLGFSVALFCFGTMVKG